MRSLPPLRLLSIVLTTLLASFASAQRAAPPKLPKPGKAIEVVFVGNSYTFFHDLPAMVRALGAAQQPPREVTTILLAPGGFTLEGHWNATGKDAPRTVLADRRPDFVVLQEQSRRPLDEPAKMHEFAALLAKLVKDRRAVAVWYMTWARKAEPEAQDRLTAEYAKVQQANGGLLAPVGRAFQIARQDTEPLTLHADDGSHPSPAGSYLAACVLFATMCGGDVMTFPDKLTQRGEDGKEHVLLALQPAEGQRLRAAAKAALADAKAGAAKRAAK
ncbi:MAG: hypothetical protein JNN13_13010 [Planctomycetes bacterium]|nr:hypothetical protein [Planctomycetota bacterium]